MVQPGATSSTFRVTGGVLVEFELAIDRQSSLGVRTRRPDRSRCQSRFKISQDSDVGDPVEKEKDQSDVSKPLIVLLNCRSCLLMVAKVSYDRLLATDPAAAAGGIGPGETRER